MRRNHRWAWRGWNGWEGHRYSCSKCGLLKTTKKQETRYHRGAVTYERAPECEIPVKSENGLQ